MSVGIPFSTNKASTTLKLLCNSNSKKELILLSSYNGRDDRIRTCAPLVPSEVRYQAALHPDKLLNCYFDLVSHLRCYLSSRTFSSLLGRVNLPTSNIGLSFGISTISYATSPTILIKSKF